MTRTIPVIQLPKAGTDKLRPPAEAGTLQVTFDGALQATIKDITDSITDTLSNFSSRGVHGSLAGVKPDVSAPGDTIASAGRGTGDGVLVLNGTSMASPLTAGISALVRSKHPDYSPLELKAAVMNNAGHDIWTGPDKSGNRYGPARVGAGRVDALRAVNADTIAFSPGPDNPVSASFGVVPAPVDKANTSKTLPLTVVNKSNRTTRYQLSYEPVVSQPGVSYSVSPSTLSVKGKSQGKAKVTMRVKSSALRHSIDPTMDKNQLDLKRGNTSPTLRVGCWSSPPAQRPLGSPCTAPPSRSRRPTPRPTETASLCRARGSSKVAAAPAGRRSRRCCSSASDSRHPADVPARAGRWLRDHPQRAGG